MRLLSWLQEWTNGRPRTRRVPAGGPAPRSRPRFEALEARWVPSTLTVTNTLDSGRGSLRAEIAAVKSSKDTIVFAPGLSGQTIQLTSGELHVTQSLTIQGPGAGQLTIRGYNTGDMGAGNFRVFEVAANINVTLSGLTISSGDSSATGTGSMTGYGGGILNCGTLTLSGCTLWKLHFVRRRHLRRLQQRRPADGQRQHLQRQHPGQHLRPVHRRGRQHLQVTPTSRSNRTRASGLAAEQNPHQNDNHPVARSARRERCLFILPQTAMRGRYASCCSTCSAVRPGADAPGGCLRAPGWRRWRIDPSPAPSQS